jgi:outer membrane autotransporter protein
MKKVILALALLAGLIGTASAIEVGVLWDWERGTNGHTGQAAGVSVGEKLGKLDPSLSKVGVQTTFDRSTSGSLNTNRYTATASYDVFKFSDVTVDVRAGIAYLDPQSTHLGNGAAGLVGFGVSYPVTEKVALVADYAYQKGNNITKEYNGNIITTGVKYSF